MARKQLYQLYDTKAGVVSGPILSANKPAPMVRSFNELLADKNTDPGKYPEDYQLLHVGEQDEETGIITPAEHGPATVATGTQWLEAQLRVNEGSPGESR